LVLDTEGFLFPARRGVYYSYRYL